MAQAQFLLCTAGNVEIPAYLALRQKGYTISASDQAEGNGSWSAEKDGLRFQGDSLIEVLGLVSIYEARGTNWAATDNEIEDFLKKFEA